MPYSEIKDTTGAVTHVVITKPEYDGLVAVVLAAKQLGRNAVETDIPSLPRHIVPDDYARPGPTALGGLATRNLTRKTSKPKVAAKKKATVPEENQATLPLAWTATDKEHQDYLRVLAVAKENSMTMLRAFRHDRKIVADVVREALKISQTQLSRYERGEKVMPDAYYEILAKFYTTRPVFLREHEAPVAAPNEAKTATAYAPPSEWRSTVDLDIEVPVVDGSIPEAVKKIMAEDSVYLLRAWRRYRGIPAAVAATTCGISTSMIALIEIGRVKDYDKYLPALAQLYKTTEASLKA